MDQSWTGSWIGTYVRGKEEERRWGKEFFPEFQRTFTSISFLLFLPPAALYCFLYFLSIRKCSKIAKMVTDHKNLQFCRSQPTLLLYSNETVSTKIQECNWKVWARRYTQTGKAQLFSYTSKTAVRKGSRRISAHIRNVLYLKKPNCFRRHCDTSNSQAYTQDVYFRVLSH
jgi:hypothetical protein